MSAPSLTRRSSAVLLRVLAVAAILAASSIGVQAHVTLIGAPDFELNTPGGEIVLPVEYDATKHNAVIAAVVRVTGPNDRLLPAGAVQATAPCPVEKGVGTCRLKVSPGAFAEKGAYTIKVHAVASGASTASHTLELKASRTSPSIEMEVKGGPVIEAPVHFLFPIRSSARAELAVRDLTDALPLNALAVTASHEDVTVVRKVIDAEAGEIAFDLIIDSGAPPGLQEVTLQTKLDGVEIGRLDVSLNHELRLFWPIGGAMLAVLVLCAMAGHRLPSPCVKKLQKRVNELRTFMAQAIPGEDDQKSDWGRKLIEEVERHLYEADIHIKEKDVSNAAINIDMAEAAYYGGLAERARELHGKLQLIKKWFGPKRLTKEEKLLAEIEHDIWHGRLEKARVPLDLLSIQVLAPPRSAAEYEIDILDPSELWVRSHILFRVVKGRSGPVAGSAEWTYSDDRTVRNPAAREVRSFMDSGLYAVRATFETPSEKVVRVVQYVGIRPLRVHDQIQRWQGRHAWKVASAFAVLTGVFLFLPHTPLWSDLSPPPVLALLNQLRLQWLVHEPQFRLLIVVIMALSGTAWVWRGSLRRPRRAAAPPNGRTTTQPDHMLKPEERVEETQLTQ